MKKLIRYELGFELALQYVKQVLDNTNQLSSHIIDLINFNSGCFYTLLTNDINQQNLHHFNWGGILPQNPIQEYFVRGKKATFSVIPTVQKELSEWIREKINYKTSLSCIFDDVLRSVQDKDHSKLFYNYGCFYDDEVYYVIHNTTSSEIIEECLEQSDATWHSLFVITTANFGRAI